jgi:UDP-galactopyranose mutase
LDRADVPIVVFSHLRWDSVFQRPQQLLSRLSRRTPVFFVEEPLPTAPGEPEAWDLRLALPRLQVCRPLLEDAAGGFDAGSVQRLQVMMARLLGWLNVECHIAWLYTPMAWPIAEALAPEAVAYDCMDELSAFLGAPPEMVAREAELLDAADVVFTGGPSLYAAKSARHPRVRCLPSSVQARDFRIPRNAEPADQALLTRPRLGFFGVIDERIDRHLLAAIADAHPEWQVVLIGPVVKIDPASLPRRPNLHYLGQREYRRLPAYVAGWDVCLMPFAHNDATRFISPTKTLEYMAAEKPIASTSIRDVAEPYGEIVYLGDGPAGFVGACERALAAGPLERAARTGRMRQVLETTSWEATVDVIWSELRVLLAQRLRQRPARGGTALAQAAAR